MSDFHSLILEVDGGPSEAEDFFAPETEEQREVEQLIKRMAFCRVKELLCFLVAEECVICFFVAGIFRC